MVFDVYINRGGLKSSIYIHGKHSNIIFGQYIFIPKVAELRLFGGPLAVIQYIPWNGTH